MEHIGEIAGYTAATLAMLAFLPQVIKTLKTRESKSLSASTLTLSFLGNFCWLINGLAYGNQSLIFSGLFIMGLLSCLFWVKLQNKELTVIDTIQKNISKIPLVIFRADP